MSSDPDIRYHIGVVYYNMKMFAKAHKELLIARDNMEDSDSSRLHNQIGMCEAQLGDIENCIQSYEKAIQLDPDYLDCYINYAITAKEIGMWEKSDTLLSYVISSPLARGGGSVNMLLEAHRFKASLFYGLGRYSDSLPYALKFLDLSTKFEDKVSGFLQIALCYQCLGNFEKALYHFEQILLLDKEHYCQVLVDIIYFYCSHLDEPMNAVCIDSLFDPLLKEVSSKRLKVPTSTSDAQHRAYSCSRTTLIENSYQLVNNLRRIDSNSEFNKLQQILRISSRFGGWIQLDTPGFLPNARQQRMFGLAVMEMASALRMHCKSLVDGRGGLVVNDIGSSNRISNVSGTHVFGYRDFFDIVVKWRQISEPNDAVWWIDRLTPSSFEEGFGLQTPMVNGELKCIRYHSYFGMGFDLLKKILCEDFYFTARGEAMKLSHQEILKVKSANTLREIYDVIQADFYVICPCESSISKDAVLLDGTRLTVIKQLSDGFNFSIRSPGLPARWKAMDREMDASFTRVITSIRNYMETGNIDSARGVLEEGLGIFFYWANFAPLTRGTAFCGYAAIVAILLSIDKQVACSIPRGIQLDWEALFTSQCSVFVTGCMKWMNIVECSFVHDPIMQYPFGTVRQMMVSLL